MGTEIERKFLVVGDGWRASVARQSHFRQGYLATNDRCSVRVRLADDKGYLNIKSFELQMRRTEFEYPVPGSDAIEMLDHLCAKPLIEKTRYFVEHHGHLWEVDVFEGDNAELVVAEIELQDVDERFDKPDWIGAEVTEDPRYYNVNLIDHPFKDWR